MKDVLPSIEFVVNGKKYSVDRDVDAETKLVDFLRRSACLTGTKWMCREGGCGACTVTLTTVDTSGKRISRAVNSCLLPLLSCDDTEITTVEGLGNKKIGYHPLQTQLADMNGTQCGYCSPGMVMSMHSLVEEKGAKNVTMEDVEMALAGNICRCTGYRPIMDAFKTFAKDATPDLKQHCIDLEDIGKKLCPKTGSACAGLCSENGINGSGEGSSCSSGKAQVDQSKIFQMENWYRPYSLAQLLDVLKTVGKNSKYQLVAGNTGAGVYKDDGPYDAYIDVTRIEELHAISQTTQFTVGGNVTIAAFMNALSCIPSVNPDYWYGPILVEHLEKIGSVPIRNVGSLAGNLMMKHAHPEFPSDLFIILETVGAKLNLKGIDGDLQLVNLVDFMHLDMKGRIIYNIVLPPLTEDHVIRTFKIMPRSCHSHAYINAGFCSKIQREESIRFVGKPTLVFGGLRSTLTHASKTEEFLSDKTIDQDIFQASLKVLDQELNPEDVLLNPDVHYLKTVAQGLFYKFILNILGDEVPPALKTGALELERGISSGKQDYATEENEWPVNKPTIKVEARAQTAGEAHFIDDMPLRGDELHGAFVISNIANCYLDNVDPTPALGVEGVVAFFDAKNIKASNKFVLAGGLFDSIEDEEVFCSGKVLYAGQPIGLVVAKTREQAQRAARLVQIKYKDRKKPALTFKEAMQEPARVIVHEYFGPPDQHDVGNFDEEISRAEKIIEGEFEMGSQFHFYMETLIACCIPTEDGLDVFCSTQDQDTLQSAIANCLGIQRARVNVQTRRLGGAYGGKASRSNLVGSACAIAASELSKPVRIALDLNTNMSIVNGRTPYYCQYKAGVTKDGVLQAVEMKIATDCGSNFNEGTSHFAAAFAKNCYSAKAWKFIPLLVKTDTPSYTYCRAPGSSQGIAIIENLMEHLAKACNTDPLEYRMKNLACGENGEPHRILSIIDHIRSSSEFDERRRQVQDFNRNNRWKKRGISLVPMVNTIDYAPIRYNVLVAIHHNGGSISVSHGGIECGQGINTKVAQVVARELGVDISLISVKPTNTLTNANGAYTGGSTTSELNCYAAIKACQLLNKRIRPTKEKMPDADWTTLIEQCFNDNVDLTARHYYSAIDNLKGYEIHSATVTEVEVDVLTGEKLIRRVDILEDVGQSISPLIDIGQIEGAFMMGLGWWTSEEVAYNPDTGEKLNRGTWNYKPPLNRDTPVDFRVTILKNAAHESGVLRSKATGEPPLCMAVSVLFALRNAIDGARENAGDNDWYRFDGPATIDKLHKLMLASAEQFNIN